MRVPSYSATEKAKEPSSCPAVTSSILDVIRDTSVLASPSSAAKNLIFPATSASVSVALLLYSSIEGPYASSVVLVRAHTGLSVVALDKVTISVESSYVKPAVPVILVADVQ